MSREIPQPATASSDDLGCAVHLGHDSPGIDAGRGRCLPLAERKFHVELFGARGRCGTASSLITSSLVFQDAAWNHTRRNSAHEDVRGGLPYFPIGGEEWVVLKSGTMKCLPCGSLEHAWRPEENQAEAQRFVKATPPWKDYRPHPVLRAVEHFRDGLRRRPR